MRILLTVATVAALFVAAAPDAWARSMRMERMESDIQVRLDGAVVVTETMRVQFRGFWNGIFRVIPYGQDMGLFRSMRQLDIISVTDDVGTTLEHWEERKRGKVRVKIRVPGAKDATRIIKLQYVMKHIILASDSVDDADFGDMDLLLWNATGDDWPMSLDEVIVRVRLPDAIKPESARAVAYTGRYGVRARNYKHTIADGAHVFETTRRLEAGEAISIGLYFPPGIVKRPSAFALLWYGLKANWMVLLPLILVVSWTLFWWFKGRDPLEDTVIAEFEAPYGLRPTEVGTLIDDRMDPRDLSAAFVDLAVRGVIGIEGAKDKDETAFVLKDRESADLAKWENTLLDKVFEGGETQVTLKSLRKTFPRSSGDVRGDVLTHLVDAKMYPKSPDTVYGHWNGMTFMMMLIMIAVGVKTSAPPIYWIAFLPVVIVMFIAARAMPRRTKFGLKALARIKGLEDYLRTAEKERMAQLPLDRLEKLLPYAIALGVHERWAEHMAGLYEGNPSWYSGSTSGVLWIDGLNGLNGGVRQSIAPISRVGSSGTGAGGWGSSWGGGTFSGGGGFSGGGFGGGGGGGW